MPDFFIVLGNSFKKVLEPHHVQHLARQDHVRSLSARGMSRLLFVRRYHDNNVKA